MSTSSINLARILLSIPQSQHTPPFIDVPVGAGEHLPAQEVVERAVMQALHTPVRDKARRFLEHTEGRWSALPPRVPADGGSGKAAYRFTAPLAFWHDVAAFRQVTGEVASQNAPPVPATGERSQPLAEHSGIDRHRQTRADLQQRLNHQQAAAPPAATTSTSDRNAVAAPHRGQAPQRPLTNAGRVAELRAEEQLAARAEAMRQNGLVPRLSYEVALPAGYQDWSEVSSPVLLRDVWLRIADEKGVPRPFANQWITNQMAQGSLRYYDITTNKDMTPTDAIGTASYHAERRTLRVGVEYFTIKQLESDYRASRSLYQSIEDWVSDPRKTAGERFLDVVTPVLRGGARTLDIVTRPVQAASTLVSGTQHQIGVGIAASFGDKEAQRVLPHYSDANVLNAAWKRFRTGETPEGYEQPIAEFADLVYQYNTGQRLPWGARMVLEIGGDPLTYASLKLPSMPATRAAVSALGRTERGAAMYASIMERVDRRVAAEFAAGGRVLKVAGGGRTIADRELAQMIRDEARVLSPEAAQSVAATLQQQGIELAAPQYDLLTGQHQLTLTGRAAGEVTQAAYAAAVERAGRAYNESIVEYRGNASAVSDPLLAASRRRGEMLERTLAEHGLRLDDLAGTDVQQAKRLTERAADAVGGVRRVPAEEIMRRARAGEGAGEYVVRVVPRRYLTNPETARLTGSERAWFAPLDEVVGLKLKQREVLDAVGYPREYIEKAQAGEYVLLVYRTADLQHMAVPTRQNIIELARASDSFEAYREMPQEFWDKVMDFDYRPHFDKMQKLNISIYNAEKYAARLSPEEAELFIVRAEMQRKLGVNENFGGEGWTLSPEGQGVDRVRVREFMFSNERVVDSAPHVILELRQ